MNRLNDIDKAEKDVDYRAANLRAGYVYIISNIGSFGENVYKIGMTRRLDPMNVFMNWEMRPSHSALMYTQ